MNQTVTESKPAGGASKLQHEIRARIDSLSYLPTTVSVAMKFVELGKNPEAEPSDYAKIISADTSLSAKILGLANSSWYGVRNKVTTVNVAVNLLGLGTVRTLAISYCMTGLHNELDLTTDESRMFWESALCKAVAAKHYVSAQDKKLADEGFVAGMFQDFAMVVMYASAKDPLLAILQNPGNDVQTLLQKERDLFGLDHTDVGRMLAQKLQLPDVFVDAVAFHHNYGHLTEFMEQKSMANAVYVASLFPHMLNLWDRRDADELCRFLDEQSKPGDTAPAAFLTAVQEEFDELYRYFEEKSGSETALAELMQTAARDAADDTTHLVATVQELMRQAAQDGMKVHQLVSDQAQLEDMATHDQLTGTLNREGFCSQANEVLAKAGRYGCSFAVVYLDIDRFKTINDTHGHEFGDLALKKVAGQMQDSVREHDLVGRVGGDEFVLLLDDCTQEDAQQTAEQIVSAIAGQPIGQGERSDKILMSAGCLWVRPSNRECSLDTLMYEAKRAGGNRVQTRAVRA